MLEQLRGLREDMDLKQKDVAAFLNVSQNTYSDYEHGKINIPVASLIKLAQYFDTSIDFIVGITKERKPYPRVK